MIETSTFTTLGQEGYNFINEPDRFHREILKTTNIKTITVI